MQLTFSSIALLLGVNVGIMISLNIDFYLDMIFVFLSIIAGVILHEILQHIPNRDEGSVLYFVIGAAGFGIIYVISLFF
jgi:hypothetical protein